MVIVAALFVLLVVFLIAGLNTSICKKVFEGSKQDYYNIETRLKKEEFLEKGENTTDSIVTDQMKHIKKSYIGGMKVLGIFLPVIPLYVILFLINRFIYPSPLLANYKILITLILNLLVQILISFIENKTISNKHGMGTSLKGQVVKLSNEVDLKKFIKSQNLKVHSVGGTNIKEAQPESDLKSILDMKKHRKNELSTLNFYLVDVKLENNGEILTFHVYYEDWYRLFQGQRVEVKKYKGNYYLFIDRHLYDPIEK